MVWIDLEADVRLVVAVQSYRGIGTGQPGGVLPGGPCTTDVGHVPEVGAQVLVEADVREPLGVHGDGGVRGMNAVPGGQGLGLPNSVPVLGVVQVGAVLLDVADVEDPGSIEGGIAITLDVAQ
ncbi:hypothetical protein DSECCO2_621280 [anaerobic digester metagenome]